MDKQRWLRLWHDMDAQSNPNGVYARLAARYAEPHRVYHTLAHIEHCLDELERAQQLALNLNAVALALWYHDVVYSTRATDNEERSAALATRIIRNAALPESFGQLVTNLILATKHSAIPTDPDARLLCDIDLSILGQPKERFDEYERQIRGEYIWVPWDSFVSGRTRVLRSFLERPRIFSTDSFCDRYENRARHNIVRSLRALNKEA